MTAAHTRHTYMCHGGLLSRYLLLTRPVRYLYRYRCYTGTGILHLTSSQALCATLFFFRNCSSAVAVAVQWQWARSPQCSAQCCVLRAACSACCSSVPQLHLCSSSALQWCCCGGGGGGVCVCIHSHSQTQSPARGTAHSIVVLYIYIYYIYVLPMRAYAGCGVYDTCIVHRIYLVYTIHRRLLDRPRLP